MTAATDVIGERYELRKLLGRGGMGSVYRAWDAILGRDVAVKLLSYEHAHDATFVARFEREARIAAALQRPNIVAVFDTGFQAARPFIVMEYVPGCDLAALLREHGRMSVPQAVAIARSIADALAEAHRAGIIHRDVKPANVLIDNAGRVKVTDFGIARMVGGTTLTQAPLILGSAPYLAPEVIHGERADQRSDIYSLGCVLYELLIGRPPFTGQHAAAVMHQQTSAPPRSPRELIPAIPESLDALVLRMLAKRAPARPQLAASVVLELDSSLQSGHAATARRPGAEVATGRASASSLETATGATDVLAPRRRLTGRGKIARRAGLALAFSSVALVLALAFALAGHRHNAKASAPTRTSTQPQAAAGAATNAHHTTTPPANATRTVPPPTPHPAPLPAPPPAHAPETSAPRGGGPSSPRHPAPRHGGPHAPAAKPPPGRGHHKGIKPAKPAKHHGD